MHALHRGPHKSCHDHIAFLQEEFKDMISKGQWLVLPYSTVKDLPGLRLSPPGVVPQRNRRPRWICDYSWWGINADTLPLAAKESMQFGHALDRILRELLLADPAHGPVYLIKIDIADGFYRIAINIDDIPKLGVVFPTLPGEEPLVAFPLVLPMGWSNSPPIFSTATETIADLANKRLNSNTHMPAHHLDDLAQSIPSPPPLCPLVTPPDLTRDSMCPLVTPSGPTSATSTSLLVTPPLIGPTRDPSLPTSQQPLAYTDVFVDDFIGAAQDPQCTHQDQDFSNRRRVRKALLHSIDDVFQPLLPNDNPTRQEPVSIKKLREGDCSYGTLKLILGWIIDTVNMTIQLPQHRVDRLAEILASIPATQHRTSVKKWHSILGELRSMALALPGSRNIFSTMQHALTTKSKGRIALNKDVHNALDDFRWMHNNIATRPTRIAEIIPLLPAAEGHHDASGIGAGGVWFLGDNITPREGSVVGKPILWRYKWPQFIVDRLITEQNPNGTISNSDLELAGGLLHLDVITHCFDVRERTILSKGDNLSTTFWERNGSTTSIKPPAHLLRLFGIHQRIHRYVPRFDYISGPSNHVADALSPRWMSTLDPVKQHCFSRDFGTAQQTVLQGISPGRATSTATAWDKWIEFTTDLGLDPFLQAFNDKIPFLQVFAARVHSGELAASGNPIRARSAEDYVRAVGQTFLHVGADDPRLNSASKIDFRISRTISAWKKSDAPPKRVKPIPLQVIRRIASISYTTFASPLCKAIADMIILAFFFLLRPGEYTDNDGDTDKHPFRIEDVQLFIGDTRLNLLTDPESRLKQARFASLTFTSQKNGVRGEVIGLACSGDPVMCPVKSIVRRILYLRQHGAIPSTPLAHVYNSTTLVTAAAITDCIRSAVSDLGPTLGFMPCDVSARCLRAAGATALLLAQVDTDIIRLIGRWRSDEMLRYLHVQAYPLMRNYAQQMLSAGTYTLIPNHLVPMQ